MLSAYPGGPGPIQPSLIADPYQSHSPLNSAFNSFAMDGRWMIKVQQDISQAVLPDGTGLPSTAILSTHPLSRLVNPSSHHTLSPHPQLPSHHTHTPSLIAGTGISAGTIGDCVLIITDLAGFTRTYYQDLSAVVTTTPKYGTLTATFRWEDTHAQGVSTQPVNTPYYIPY